MYGITAPQVEYKGHDIIYFSDGFQPLISSTEAPHSIATFIIRNKNITARFMFIIPFGEAIIPETWRENPLEQAEELMHEFIDGGIIEDGMLYRFIKSGTFFYHDATIEKGKTWTRFHSQLV